MQENTSSSVNGESQSQVPPGFRFHPTEEELLDYYLRKKVSYQKIDLDVICDIDLNKLEPWEIQKKCRTGSTPQNDCYFFSLKDKKYPTGTRTNRATAAGFWKATGRDKIIYRNCGRIGMRKTLVFYQGRAPYGQKSDWIMHEYRLDDNSADTNVCQAIGEAEKEDGWVVCHIFKKKNYIKSTTDCNPNSFTINQETRTGMQNSCNGDLQTLQCMGSTCTEENEANRFLLHPNEMDIDNCYRDKFTKLPRLETQESSSSCQNYYEVIREEMITNNVNEASMSNETSCYINESGLTSWAALDRLIASQLNGEMGSSRQLACCFNESSIAYPTSNDHDM